MDKKKITETLEFLETLSTERLQAYYQSLQKVRKVYHYGRQTLSEAELSEWDLHIEDVKKILDNKEHIEVEKDFKCGGKDMTYKRLKERAEELKKKKQNYENNRI